MIFPRREDATNKDLILTIIEIQGYLSRYGKSHTNWHETLNEVIARLEQKSKIGHWIDREIYDADRWKCSECKRTEPYKENYCPKCGADMRGEQHD